MADDGGALITRLATTSTLLDELIERGKRILVVTHIDADGLSSGSIAFQALARKGAAVSVRAIPDLDQRTIEQLANDRFDYYLFTDLASGLLNEVRRSMGEQFLVVDHHQISPGFEEDPNVINAWNFGYDGGTEACSSTMAYSLSVSMDKNNKTLSPLAIVGALGDRQDSGPERSLTGLNRRALEDAVSAGLVSLTKDFLFHGRETRPIHEAIGMTYTPFIDGLSGAKDAALAALSNAGLRLKDGRRWRTLAELTGEEKQKLLDILASFASSSANSSVVISGLIGEVYSFQLEDPLTPLHDGREFATVLNACGRIGRTDVGIALSLGDREQALSEAQRLMTEYRLKLNKALQVLQAGTEKIESRGDVLFVIGDEFIEERMTGSISSLLASSVSFRDKLVLVRARSGETELKFSSRRGDAYTKDVNLGTLMKDAAAEVGGVGGGHSMAAGAKIPLTKHDDFTRAILQRVPK